MVEMANNCPIKAIFSTLHKLIDTHPHSSIVVWYQQCRWSFRGFVEPHRVIAQRRVHKHLRIQPSSQEPESSDGSPKSTIQVTYRFFKRVLFFEAIPLLVILLLPVLTHADFFAFFDKLTDAARAEHPTIAYNPQTIPLLKAAVHPDPNPSKGGGDIVVNEDGTLVPEAGPSMGDNCDTTENEGIYLYTVRPDENLSNIANAFCISTKTVLWANDIRDPDIIQPGDELVILPITGVNHVVKDGDTLKKIVKKYFEDAEESDIEGIIEDVIAYNQLAGPGDLAVGQAIVIPGGEIAPPPAPKTTSRTYANAPVSSAPAGGFTHPLPGSRKTQGLHGYNGVDLGGVPLGSSVRAAAAGDVIVARASGWNGGYGSYVVVKHDNGTQTLYAHLSRVNVSVGMRVGAGQTIGGVGSTGRSTGVHLHFEVRGARNPF